MEGKNERIRCIILENSPVWGDKMGERVLLGHLPKGSLAIVRGWRMERMRQAGEAESVKKLAVKYNLPYKGTQKEAEAIQQAVMQDLNIQPVKKENYA